MTYPSLPSNVRFISPGITAITRIIIYSFFSKKHAHFNFCRLHAYHYKGFKNPWLENRYWKLEELFDPTVLSPPFSVDPVVVQSAMDGNGGQSDWVTVRSFKEVVNSKAKYIRWSSVWNDLFTEFELKRLLHSSTLSASAAKYTYNHPTILRLTSKARESAKGKLSNAIGVHLRTFRQYSWGTFCEDNYFNHPLYQTLLCIMSTKQVVENVEYYQKVGMIYALIHYHSDMTVNGSFCLRSHVSYLKLPSSNVIPFFDIETGSPATPLLST